MKYKNNETLEESLLLATDAVKDQAKDQATKMLADLFKSAILKKYKDAFDEELTRGKVQKKNIDKSVEFCYTDICVAIRQCPTMQDDEKDDLIQKGKEMIPTIKGVATQVLLNKGIKIIG
jgi:ABC-type arginine transport system ATPase subunit